MDTEYLKNYQSGMTDDNDDKLSGKEWLKYSISVWDDIKTKEEREYLHPASFPVDMIKKLVRIYTRKNQTILDPFSGIGSTLVAGAVNNRYSIGFEINPDYIKIAEKRLAPYRGTSRIINASSYNLEDYISDDSIDCCITSPPYWDILNRARTADRKDTINYGNSPEDIGNIKIYDDFIQSISIIFKKVYKCLKRGRHCIVVVMDIRKKSEFYPFHIDITNIMTGIGFELQDFIIWDRKKEYNNLRPLGYPSVFRVNKVHEYICIFKKPGVKE